ncbi:Vacuolar protein sorting-associated protein 51-like protein [Forsythia ovata]|uniref:Vacuolar protein sorting-associated protein 51 homolog n=1 Tax=Forsythia ovata TaxID=205694 RepID=A0ABD1RQL4_9LAMI
MKKTSSRPRNRKTTNALQEIKHSNFDSESVITTIVKLSLKSLQELVRFQTFNRSGIQQIQLDIQFLKSTLKDIAEDEAAVDFLLDEVFPSFSQITIACCILSSAQVVYRMFEDIIALHMYLNA